MTPKKRSPATTRRAKPSFTMEKLVRVAGPTVRANAEPLVDSPRLLKRLKDGDELSCTFYGYGASITCSVTAHRFSLQDLCTCNATYFCRHSVALVLTFLSKPESFLNLDSYLDKLSTIPRAELEEKLRHLIGRYPGSSLEALGQAGFDPAEVLDDPDDDIILTDPDDLFSEEEFSSPFDESDLEGPATKPAFDELEDLDDFDDPGSRGNLN
jgi:hypothetical protein